jgi:hypothetical protein
MQRRISVVLYNVTLSMLPNMVGKYTIQGGALDIAPPCLSPEATGLGSFVWIPHIGEKHGLSWRQCPIKMRKERLCQQAPSVHPPSFDL